MSSGYLDVLWISGCPLGVRRLRMSKHPKSVPKTSFAGKSTHIAQTSEGCLGTSGHVLRTFLGSLCCGGLPGALICRKFDKTRILLPRAFTFRISLGCDIRASRPFGESTQYGGDVSSLASVTITCTPHATRYPIVCYYSCITRYRRAHVVPFARSITCVRRRASDARIRRLLGRCECGRRETQTVH